MNKSLTISGYLKDIKGNALILFAAQVALLLASAALTALAFPPYGYLLLLASGPLVSFWFWDFSSPRMAFFWGYLFVCMLFFTAAPWLFDTPQSVAKIEGPTGLFLAIGVISLVGFSGGVVAALYAVLAKRVSSIRYKALLLFPAVWILGEWLRSWMFSGFPWFNLAYPLVDTPLSVWAPVFGIYGLSLVFLIGLGALILLAVSTRKHFWPSILVLVSIALGTVGLSNINWTTPVSDPLKVALIQSPEWGDKMDDVDSWKLTVDRTEQVLKQADLVVWPESLFNFWQIRLDEKLDRSFMEDLHQGKRIWQSGTVFLDNTPVQHAFSKRQAEGFFDPLQSLASKYGASIVTGATFTDNQRKINHNSMLVIGDQRIDVYDKHHLVPFGEFVPYLGDVLRNTSAPFWLQDSYQKPRTQNLWLPIGDYKAGVSICYESAYGETLITALPEANFLISVSNDSMFAKTAEPAQHTQILQMRALEAGRWLVRSNRYGVTAVIDPKGQEIAALPIGVDAELYSEITPLKGATPYSLWTVYPLTLLILLVMVAPLLWPVYKHRTGLGLRV